MRPSRLFWRLFLAYSAINVGAAIVFVALVTPRSEAYLTNLTRQRLQDSAVLVRSSTTSDLAGGQAADLQNKVRELGESVNMRITLIDAAGEVAADSDRDDLSAVAAMDNHQTRPEVAEALAHGVGASQRHSDTSNQMMMYAAVRVDQQGKTVGVVRTAQSMESIRSQTSQMRSSVIWVAAIVNLLVLLFTAFFVSRITRPISTLTQAATAISQGDYRQRIFVPGDGELAQLARAFSRMSQELDDQIGELTQVSDQMAAVLDAMSEGVVAVDAEERLLLANQSAGQMLGFAHEGCQGKSLLHVVRNRPLHEAVTNSLGSERMVHAETELPGASPRTLRIFAQRLAGDPCPGVVVVLHDVSEIRKLEQMRQEFVANVSHELKTPLSSIRAFAETLRCGALHDEKNAVRFLGRIEEEADRLHELILDLLSLARVQSGKEAFDIRSLDLFEHIDRRVESHQEAAAAKSIGLIVEEHPQRLYVAADSEGLREILDNLLDNAIKYSAQDTEVRIAASEQGDEVLIQVTDQGIGIGEEHLPRVFERFFRVDKARSRELGSTGLGLSIVKHLAIALHGSVSVDSTLGRGSTFTVRLPKAPRELTVS